MGAKFWAIAALAASLAGQVQAAEPAGTAVAGEVLAFIEIPAGGAIKYERDEATGRLKVDRFLSMPMAYPANYGLIEKSMAGDGDPLDVLVYTRAPIQPGALIKVRPIGVLKMLDRGDADDKIIAVPASKVDATYDAIRTIDDLPAMERQRLESFFRVYKMLPEGSNKIELRGFDGVDAAARIIDAALKAKK